MIALPEAVVSNDVQQLFETLVHDIESPSLHLLKGCIIVPDHSLRAWLSHEFSKNNISLLRVEILLLDEALERGTSDRLPLTRNHLLPQLLSFLAQRERSADLSIEPQEKRFCLARRLRIPFALRAFLGEKGWFLKNPYAEKLWEEFAAWSPLAIPSVYEASSLYSEVPLFLFGFSSIHPLLLNQFLKNPSLRRLYLLSPCMLFWGDQSSDREVRSLLASAQARHATRLSTEQLEQFLFDRHRLLANSGQVGREFLRVLEDSALQTRSQYVFPQSLVQPPYTEYMLPDLLIDTRCSDSPSILDYIKADLLLLIGKRETPCLLQRDESIQIHGAPTPLREIEALYERLVTLGPLAPSSVLVLATDLQRYKAAFEQVFGGKVSYQIWGEAKNSTVTTAFRMLINLLMSKGALPDWIQVLRNPVFQRVLELSSDDAEALLTWLSTRSIRWGLSQEHRHRYLLQRGISSPTQSNGSSFADERERFLESFLSGSSTAKIEVSLLASIGRFFRFLAIVETWFPLPLGSSSFAPMGDFERLFSNILAELLQKGPIGFEEEALLSAMASFSTIASTAGSPDIPFSEALRLFYSLVETHVSRQGFSLYAPIVIAEFGSFQPFPADLVAIVGAHEGSLPKHSEDRLFERLDRMVPGIPASNTFFDRYSFLEALLSAKNLFISHQSFAFETREALSPSPIVADLLFHLDTNYRIDRAVPTEALSFAHSLFRPRRPRLPLREIAPLYIAKGAIPCSLDISQLRRAARSPLELFYREQMAFSSYKAHEESLFMKPWKLRSHIEAGLGLDTCIVPPHPTYVKASSHVQNTLVKLRLSSIKRFDLHLLPTVVAPYTSGDAIFAPCIASFHDVVGTWPGLINEGMVLVSDQWKKELFARWPECALRSYLSSTHGIPLEHQAILIDECRIVPLPAQNDLSAWVEFANLARTTPFPYTFDIVQLLLTRPDPKELFLAICEHAEAEKESGPWSAYVHTFTEEECSRSQPLFEKYATLLWSSFFSLLEAK